MKPYLVTLASKTKGFKRFISSLENIDVEHLAIQFKPRAEVKAYTYHDIPYPGHIKKYEYVPTSLNPNRYVLFSDTDDVIFQKELPEFKADMILAKENITFKDTIYRGMIETHPEFEGMLDLEVYNSGLFAMRVPIFYDFVGYLLDFPLKTRLNQLIFNRFLRDREYSKSEKTTTLCPLFSNIYHKVEKKDGKWMKGDKVISAVHGNGFTKRLL